MEADGSVVAHMIYDPFGAPLLETYTDTNYSGLDNLNNFTGYAWDEVLGLYFAQNRFYDAATHRFTQEDAIKDGGNWYAYCENDPLNYVDPWGQVTFAIGADFSVAFGLRLAAGAQYAIDTKGNVGIVWYGGIGGGTPNASAAITGTITSAESIFDLAGEGATAGGGIFWYGAEFAAANGMIGLTLSAGVSALLSEAHTEYVYTRVTEIKNSLLKKIIYQAVSEKANGYFEQLTCEQKTLLGIEGAFK